VTSPVIRVRDSIGGSEIYASFLCPGCKYGHEIRVNSGPQDGHRWGWNGDLVRPTFTPSILHRAGGAIVCHSFVADGNIQFLADCTHELAGKTVPLVPRPGD
jgi:hypothetical protein